MYNKGKSRAKSRAERLQPPFLAPTPHKTAPGGGGPRKARGCWGESRCSRAGAEGAEQPLNPSGGRSGPCPGYPRAKPAAKPSGPPQCWWRPQKRGVQTPPVSQETPHKTSKTSPFGDNSTSLGKTSHFL